MMLKEGDIVEVNELTVNREELPRIVEGMLEFSGKIAEVAGVFEDDEVGTYVLLKDNKYFWMPNWITKKPTSYKYRDLMRLDR